MNKKLFILCLVFVTTAKAGLFRHDIDVQIYRDFAENRGEFKAGNRNVKVYRKDGSLSGIIGLMPDFSASSDGGFSTAYTPDVTLSVTHVGYTDKLTFANRFYEDKNSILFDGSSIISKKGNEIKEDSKYWLLGDRTDRAYDESGPTDYKITRMKTLITDIVPAELLQDESKIKNGLLIARVGGGIQTTAIAEGKTQGGGYFWHSGGLNVVKANSISNKDVPQNLVGVEKKYNFYNVRILLMPNPETPLDIGTMAGDSGSPMWIYDKENDKWLLYGANSAGGGSGYWKSSYLRGAPTWTMDKALSYKQATISTGDGTNVLLGAQNSSDGTGEISINGVVSDKYHGIRRDTNNYSQNDYKSNKNITFKGNGTIDISNNDIYLGAGSITFDGNYNLQGNGRLNSAGYIVTEDNVVNSSINGKSGDTWRKLGTGTLLIKGEGNNEAEINIGEGTLILDRNNGYGAKHIRVASGRGKVILKGDNQLKMTIQGDKRLAGIGFGAKGGILDISGYNQHWSDIYHMDNGATIANMKDDTTSIFTFSPNSIMVNKKQRNEREYLGNFYDSTALKQGTGKMKLVLNPITTGFIWHLSGDINISGGVDINNGNISVGGKLVKYANNTTRPTEYESSKFIVGEDVSTLGEDTLLSIKRNAIAKGNFSLSNNAKIRVETKGKFDDKKQTNEGAILSGNIDMQHTNNKVEVDIDKYFVSTIDANIQGAGNFIKTGEGAVILSGNNTFTGNAEIKDGIVEAGNISSVGNESNRWSISKKGILDVKNNADNVDNVLDKITKDSSGVLAVSGDMDKYSSKFNEYTNLYLGSRDVLNIGIDGENINDEISDYRIGGGSGTVNINGSFNADITKNIHFGSDIHDGTVFVNSHNPLLLSNISIGKGIELETKYDDSLGSSSLTVEYGALLGIKYIDKVVKEEISAGNLIIDIDNKNLDMSSFTDISIGAKKGEVVDITEESGLVATKTGYYFGGTGELNIDTALTGNNNIYFDAQGYTSKINILKASKTVGDVVIRGSRDDKDIESSMIVKLKAHNIFSDNNNLVIKNKGELDLNGKILDITLKETDDNTKIYSDNVANLWLTTNEDITLNSSLSGKINISKYGDGLLSITKNNEYLIGEFNINKGKVKQDNYNALGSIKNRIVVRDEGQLILNGYSVGTLFLDGNGNTVIEGKADSNRSSSIEKIRTITDSTLDHLDNVEIKEYELNGKTITIKNSKLNNFGNAISDNGDIILENVNLNSVNPTRIFNSEGNIVLKNSKLDIRDMKSNNKTKRTLVLDGNSRLTNGRGNEWGNGGGGQSIFSPDIRIENDNNAITAGNTLFGRDMIVESDLSGNGNVKIDGGKRTTFTGNVEDFTGNFLLSTIDNITFDGANEQIISAGFKNIKGRSVLKHNKNKTLILQGDNTEYTGDMEVSNEGILVFKNKRSLGGENNNIFSKDSSRIIVDLQETEGVQLLGNISNESNSIFEKKGNGILDISSKERTLNNIEITEGILGVSKINGNNINISNGSTLKAIGDTKITANISNGGTIELQSTDNNMIITGNYTSEDGILKYHRITSLVDIKGDTSGNTNVILDNINAGDNLTSEEGQKIVKVSGESNGEFKLTDRVVLGAYDYVLDKKGKDWHLTSYRLETETEKNYRLMRPDISIYLAQIMMMDTELNTLSNVTSFDKSIWADVRVGGQGNNSKNKVENIEVSTNMGINVYNKNKVLLGLTASYLNANNKAVGTDVNVSANGEVNGLKAGIYAYYNKYGTGVRVNALAQYGYTRNNVKEQEKELGYNMNGFNMLIDTSYAIEAYRAHDMQIIIEPQLSYSMGTIKLGNHKDLHNFDISSNIFNSTIKFGINAEFHSKYISLILENSYNHQLGYQNIRVGNDIVDNAKNYYDFRGALDIKVIKDLSIQGGLDVRLGSNKYYRASGYIGLDYRF